MGHLIVKAVSNGNGSVRWKTIDDIDNLRDVFDYYAGKSIAFKEKNVYYQISPCQYSKTKAKKDEVLNNSLIPIDIDGMDRDDIEDLEKYIVEFFDKLGVKDYITINSGNGLHALISIGTLASGWIEKNKKAIVDTIYSPISSIAQEYGGNIDKKVLESSRILRVPNTMNVKDGKSEAQCKIITDNWLGEGNASVVEMIQKTTSSKVMESHNVSFNEITEAFAKIGGKWSHHGHYSYLEHPERGSKKTLALYRDAKFFYSFSDKDEFPFLQLTDIWNMYGSGQACPFSQFDSGNIHQLVCDKLRIDARYAVKNTATHYIVAAEKRKGGITTAVNLTPTLFNRMCKSNGIRKYLDSLGVSHRTFDDVFMDLISSLPVSMYDAEPIDTEKNKIISKWVGIATMKFDKPASELESRTQKANLIGLVEDKDYDSLAKISVSISDEDEKKICLTYTSLRSMFDQKADYFAESEIEFQDIMRWLGLKTSEKGGLLCIYKNKRLSFVENQKLEK